MNSKPMQVMDPRVDFIRHTLTPHGNMPWQSEWGQVPRQFHAKVHRFAKYITAKNFEKYRNRDVNLTFHRLLQQTTRGYMGEIAFYCIYGVFNNYMAPDWFVTPDEHWPLLRVDWSPDHLGHAPPTRDFSDPTVGFEDKTGRECDPGWAIQWNTEDRRSRTKANRMPLAYGAVGPNYFLVLMEHRENNGTHLYRVAAITRGIDVFNMRNFRYRGVPLIGPMANGNRNKQQLTKEVLYNSGIDFFRPAWVRGPQVKKPLFTEEDFPAMVSTKKRKSCLKKSGSKSKRLRVTFDQRPDKIRIIENCLCKADMEDGEIVDELLEYLKKTGVSKMIPLAHNEVAQAAWEVYLEDGDKEEMDDTFRRIVKAKWGDLMYDRQDRSVTNWETMFKRMRASVNW